MKMTPNPSFKRTRKGFALVRRLTQTLGVDSDSPRVQLQSTSHPE